MTCKVSSELASSHLVPSHLATVCLYHITLDRYALTPLAFLIILKTHSALSYLFTFTLGISSAWMLFKAYNKVSYF